MTDTMSNFDKERDRISQRVKLATEIVELKNRAGGLGLWRTVKKLDTAAEVIGWEIAGIEVVNDD